jgi:hypothetical protein
MFAQGRGGRSETLHASRAGPAVRIAAVEEPSESRHGLLASGLDSPAPGDSSDRFSIDLRGWVAARDSPPVEVTVHCHGERLMTTPIDISRAETERRLPERAGGGPIGFRATMGAFPLPPRFEFSMRVRLQSGDTVPLAEVRGSRLSLRAHSEAALRPIVVSTPTGRTGTSWAVNLLSQHPQLVAQPPLGMEPRPATYWLEAAAALAEPASYMQALRPRMQHADWWLGGWPEAARHPPPEEPLASLLGRDGVVRLAAFARERVEAFYAAVANEQGKSPTAFVEKAPTGRRRVDLMADVFPGLREVVLVRDPRDTLCSILAYTRKRPNAMLVRAKPGTDDEYLRLLARSFEGILRDARDRSDSAEVVRYEDLVLEPRETLRGVLEHVRADNTDETITGMLERAAGHDLLALHRTATTATASVGRWREEMEPDLQARAESTFGDLLARLGYA